MMKETVLINSQKRNYISVFDRCFQFGDGLFETMKLEGNRLLLWKQHYQRLIQGCKCLKIIEPKQDDLLLQLSKAVKISRIKTYELAILKLVITRGYSRRGYGYDPTSKPNTIILVLSYPNENLSALRMSFCQNKLVENPALAGIKHCNRLEQVLLSPPGSKNCIVLDQSDRVICASASNLFLIEKNTLSTPDLSSCGIAGTARSKILDLASLLKVPLRIEKITKQRLLAADAVFVCNSLFGIRPISEISDRCYKPNPLLKHLQQAYQEEVQKNAQLLQMKSPWDRFVNFSVS